MDSFMEALLSEKTGKIPDAYDWFAPLIGDWDFEYHEGYHTDALRTVKGEWIFRRVLNGAGIEDLFICPSRETMKSDPSRMENTEWRSECLMPKKNVMI